MPSRTLFQQLPPASLNLQPFWFSSPLPSSTNRPKSLFPSGRFQLLPKALFLSFTTKQTMCFSFLFWLTSQGNSLAATQPLQEVNFIKTTANITIVKSKEMATHSSVLAWRIPETEEPSGLPSMGSHRVGHDWSDLAAAAECFSAATVTAQQVHSWTLFSAFHSPILP